MNYRVNIWAVTQNTAMNEALAIGSAVVTIQRLTIHVKLHNVFNLHN